MQINLKMMDYYAKIAGRESAAIEIDTGSFFEFADAVKQAFPGLEVHVGEATFIVNGDLIAQPKTILSNGDQVYMLIPLAGG